MIFKELNGGSCRTYLVGSERTREVVLIDPLLASADRYLALLRDEELKLRWVLDTHTHADHLSGGGYIQEKAGVHYLMHLNSEVRCVSKRLRERDALGLGEVTMTFLHTPGHTRDSLTILLPDRFLSGDFLFIGDAAAGRLDLPGGSVEAHYQSLRKLDTLPDEALVYPAHDYRGKTSSTLGMERRGNPLLKPQTRDDYLRWWNDLRLGPADWMRRVLDANSACTQDPQAAPIPTGGAACEPCAPRPAVKVAEVSVRELQGLTAKSDPPFLLDVREPAEFTGELGHVPGSRLVPLGQLAARVAELPRDRVVVAICRSGNRSARAAALLLEAGFPKVYSLRGGMQAWDEEELPVER